MHVLPPAKGQTAHEVADEDAYERINVEVVCNAYVASIMGSEEKLVPEHAHEDGAGDIPSPVKGKRHQTKQHAVPPHLIEVCTIVAVV